MKIKQKYIIILFLFILIFLVADCKKSNILNTLVATPAINVLPVTPNPQYSPGGGTYSSTQTITITCSLLGATIRYTTDGSTPSTTNGTVYSVPVNISGTTYLKSIAYYTGYQNSAIVTELYTLTQGSGGSGQFTYPYGITTDGTYLYIAGMNNNLVKRMDLLINQSGTAWTAVSSGSATMSGPRGVTYSAGYLYVADYSNNRILKINASTPGSTADVLTTGISNPRGICNDGTYLYVLCNNGRLYKIIISTGAIDTANFNSPNGYVSTGQAGMCTFDSGVVYTSDLSGGTINKYNASNGSSAGTFSIAGVDITGIFIRSGYLYSATGGSGGQVVKSNLSGIIQTTWTPTGAGVSLRGICFAGTQWYVADGTNNLIHYRDDF